MRAHVILSCLILQTLPSFTQINDPIIDTNKVWYTHIYIYCCSQVNTEVIGIGQDTIVNDTAYNKVLRATGGFEIPYQSYGLIREDSSNRIYYKTLVDNPGRLIYDYSISEGDTIIAYGLMDWAKDEFIECQYICDSIRDEEYYQVCRKVFYLTALLGHVPEKWIEGIGSSSGLLHNFDGRVGGDAFYLSCVKSDDNFLYRKSESEPCIKIALGLEDKTPNDPLIYPNPIGNNQELYVRNFASGSIIELYDAIGKLVHKVILNSSENSLEINVESGIYFYRLIDEKEGYVNTGRLIFE